MIVRDIMTTRLVTVEPDDTLGHAANLLRQHQFHHLPVARSMYVAEGQHSDFQARRKLLLFEGMLTSQDIDLAVAAATGTRTWQEQRVVEMMHRALLRVTPTTSVAAAAQLLVERGLNFLPVIEYQQLQEQTHTVLVGLLTRSDLLLALARAMGAFEPGMQLDILLPAGSFLPLAETLRIASEMRMQVRSILSSPHADGTVHRATLRLGTINPTPLLMRLQEAGIHYAFANPLTEEDSNAQ